MVPTRDDCETLVIAVFRREDLLRLHSVLACFESPYRTDGEVGERLADEECHERLRREIALLLQK